MKDIVTVTVYLTDVNYDKVESLSEQTKMSKTDIINKAIQTEKFINDCQAEGKKILIEDQDGNIEEVTFP